MGWTRWDEVEEEEDARPKQKEKDREPDTTESPSTLAMSDVMTKLSNQTMRDQLNDTSDIVVVRKFVSFGRRTRFERSSGTFDLQQFLQQPSSLNASHLAPALLEVFKKDVSMIDDADESESTGFVYRHIDEDGKEDDQQPQLPGVNR